jgi:hypothetical protein
MADITTSIVTNIADPKLAAIAARVAKTFQLAEKAAAHHADAANFLGGEAVKRLALLCTFTIGVCTIGAWAADGVAPRKDVVAYPAHSERENFAIGADLLDPGQVRGAFVTELNRGYLVVEIGFFPRGEINVSTEDFSLREAVSQKVSRPVSPKVVAGVLQKTAPDQRNVDLYPSVGVGYESGRCQETDAAGTSAERRRPCQAVDPVTGRRSNGGWNTSTGVGVGVGGTRPGATDADRKAADADRKTMALELSEKELPDGKTSRPVGGYLYFPVPRKHKNVAYDLEYNLGGDKIVLPLTREQHK